MCSSIDMYHRRFGDAGEGHEVDPERADAVTQTERGRNIKHRDVPLDWRHNLENEKLTWEASWTLLVSPVGYE